MTVVATKDRSGGSRYLSVFLLGLLTLYIALAVGLAGYLIYRTFTHSPTDQEKLGLAAVIGVIGTGLPALAALYTANRQAGVAQQIEGWRAESGEKLAELTASLNTQIEAMKAESSRSLERLKASLDVSKIAYRELFGAASVYFYALRSVARGLWDEESLKSAETLMLEATQHLIYVSKEMRDDWLSFWQDAQNAHQEALNETVIGKRPAIVKQIIEEENQVGRRKMSLRDKHFELENTAKAVVLSNISLM